MSHIPHKWSTFAWWSSSGSKYSKYNTFCMIFLPWWVLPSRSANKLAQAFGNPEKVTGVQLAPLVKSFAKIASISLFLATFHILQNDGTLGKIRFGHLCWKPSRTPLWKPLIPTNKLDPKPLWVICLWTNLHLPSNTMLAIALMSINAATESGCAMFCCICQDNSDLQWSTKALSLGHNFTFSRIMPLQLSPLQRRHLVEHFSNHPLCSHIWHPCQNWNYSQRHWTKNHLFYNLWMDMFSLFKCQ